MRNFLFLFLFFQLAASAAKEFDLNSLMQSAKRHAAPVELRKQLGGEMREYLTECLTQPGGKLNSVEDFFAAIPIQLTKQGGATWLAFPTQYCPSGLFGASSIPFWILQQMKDGSYKQLHSGNTHRIQVHKKVTMGFHDLVELYGNNHDEGNGISMYTFDGIKYRPY